MNGFDGSALDSSSPSVVTPASRSRRNLQDSAASSDSNIIVLQAALAELQRGHDSKLAQEALESIGDLAPDLTLDAPILSEERSMPSMDEVFSTSKTKVAAEPVVVAADMEKETEPELVEPEPAEEEAATVNETSTSLPVLVSESCATPKKDNKSRIMIKSRYLTNRLHASMDCLDFDFASSSVHNIKDDTEASPMIPSPQKKKLQLGSRHSARYLGSSNAVSRSSSGDSSTVMDQHAAMVAFTRRAPRVSKSIGAPSGGTGSLTAMRRPTIA